MSRTADFHEGDRVWVYRETSWGAMESALVVETGSAHTLRLQYTDGHRRTLHNGHVELCR